MKHFYLTLLAIFLFSVSGSAQTISWQHVSDSTLMGHVNDDIEFHLAVQNNLSADLDVRWRIVDFVPTSPNWDAYMCEELICWQSWTIDPSKIIKVIGDDDFQLFPHVKTYDDSGSAEITVCIMEVLDSASTHQCFTYMAMTDGYVIGVQQVNDGTSPLDQNFPNPFQGETTVKYDLTSDEGMIRIVDLHGKVVEEINLSSASKRVSLGNELDPGIYFYSLIDGGELMDTKRMVVLQ